MGWRNSGGKVLSSLEMSVRNQGRAVQSALPPKGRSAGQGLNPLHRHPQIFAATTQGVFRAAGANGHSAETKSYRKS